MKKPRKREKQSDLRNSAKEKVQSNPKKPIARDSKGEGRIQEIKKEKVKK